jgi:hypothetical protein
MIDLISGQVEMQFQAAGYQLPLTAISGEAWPSSQTVYLQLVTTLGTVAFANGHAQKPSPALAPGRPGGSGNLFQDLFNEEMKKIYDNARGKTFLRFRAAYYHASPAEQVIADFKGPTTDFMEGKYDPQMYGLVWDCANRILEIREEILGRYPSWDFLYNVFDLEKGLGPSIYENTLV